MPPPVAYYVAPQASWCRVMCGPLVVLDFLPNFLIAARLASAWNIHGAPEGM